MIVLAVVAVLVIAAMVATHIVVVRRMAAFFVARVVEQDAAEEGRRLAVYKQQKASERIVLRSDKAVRQMVDQARGLHDDASRALQKADRLASDQKAKD